mmetsp:Transcript_31346/g.28535  ORF Transcript_31346/g.28535 Transcript_31346/m.28535 type:complete len:205 (-) Transcript_31346:12-626(-)
MTTIETECQRFWALKATWPPKLKKARDMTASRPICSLWEFSCFCLCLESHLSLRPAPQIHSLDSSITERLRSFGRSMRRSSIRDNLLILDLRILFRTCFVRTPLRDQRLMMSLNMIGLEVKHTLMKKSLKRCQLLRLRSLTALRMKLCKNENKNFENDLCTYKNFILSMYNDLLGKQMLVVVVVGFIFVNYKTILVKTVKKKNK